jgi:hypothetical protein
VTVAVVAVVDGWGGRMDEVDGIQEKTLELEFSAEQPKVRRTASQEYLLYI